MPQNSKKDIYKCNFKHFSFKKFITDLEKVNWDNTLNVFEGNVNKSFKIFLIKLQIHLANMCLLLSSVWGKWKAVISHGLPKEF